LVCLDAAPRIRIAKLALTDFRNYKSATLSLEAGPVVLTGQNGAGKTNCLEAISLLTAGRGLRASPFFELIRNGATGWAVSTRLFLGECEVQIGTGLRLPAEGNLSARAGRTVKIDGAPVRGSGALAPVRMIWLTPAMDPLFMGPASDRRAFMDRLALSLDPAYAAPAAAFDRAMRQRNRALESFSPGKLLDAVEAQMAEAAARIATHRHSAIHRLKSEIAAERERSGETVFPWAELTLSGCLEAKAGLESEDAIAQNYRETLAKSRERDREAGRTLTGPHRSDLQVGHGPKAMAARMCSTGEQKALLVGLILAQARLIKKACGGMAPLILLDEIAAHLDEDRRLALFKSIAGLEAQVWMTGTDPGVFAPLRKTAPAQFFLVLNGTFAPLNDAESAPKH